MKKLDKKLGQKAVQIKLLAPAGNWACLRAAIKAGADSVYFGIADFNMRASAAKNFSVKDLPKIVKFCQKHGVETCLTVNTLMFDSDLSIMRKVIDAAKKAGCSGVIVADVAALEYANSVKMPSFISTQVSVANIEAVKFYSKYSDRIILARELSLDQVKAIVEQIKKEKITGPSGKLVEIEIFAHGALCVAVSGRCAMSLYNYGSSANRGRCAHACRREFIVTEVETGKQLKIDNHYVLSPKDLCTIGMLPDIVDSGATVLKLEGRGRPPEYVDTVVRCYKEALEAIVDGTYSKPKVAGWNKRLGTVFNRGFSQGLYMGRQWDEWAKGSGSQATMERLQVGKVVHYYPKAHVAEIEVLADITVKEGEKCLITGDKTGLVKTEFKGMQLDEDKFDKVKQGMLFTMKVPEKVKKNDEVYVWRKRIRI